MSRVMICFFCGFKSDDDFQFYNTRNVYLCWECIRKFQNENFDALIAKRKRELAEKREAEDYVVKWHRDWN